MASLGTPATQRQSVLRSVLLHLERDEFSAAEALLTLVLASDADEVNALHLLGQMRRVQDRLEEAEELYRRVLELAPHRFEAHVHLGQLLRLQGRGPEAVAALREAVRVKSDNAEAHLDLGLALSDVQNDVEAEKACRRALQLRPDFPAASQALSAILIKLERHHDAERVASNGLLRRPRTTTDVAALSHNLAIALSGQLRHDEALKHFTLAKRLSPDLPRLAFNRANTLQMLGKLDDAESSYLDAVRKDPLDLKAHNSLCLLRYRMGRPDFLKSFDEAALEQPAALTLTIEKARLLLKAEQFEAAYECFLRALKRAPGEFAAREGLACALTRLTRHSEAIDLYAGLVADQPSETDTLSGFSECLLRAGDANKALEIAEQALVVQPRGQLALALWGTALAQLHDAREQELNDYEHLVQVIDMEPPEGFSNWGSFHQMLEAELDALHRDAREPLNQSSRGGTQTLGRLFESGHKLVDALKSRIDEAISHAISGLKADPEHPYLGRRSRGYCYDGSWSTRLADGGYHSNHVHPRGWISSAYYITVPDEIDDGSRHGWLKFGEPAFPTPQPSTAGFSVRPQPGRLVLFPSYMWHGTIPLRSSQRRTTIAFDVVPT